jgi:hypothetical protein
MAETDLDPAALLDVLHAALDAGPSDAATRLMLADVLEDAGEGVAARGQRWQAREGKWPVGAPGGHRWWDAAYSDHGDPDDIPPGLFRLLPGRNGSPVACHYPSRRDAEADLALAMEHLARRRAVLAGYEPGPCPWCGERAWVRSGADNACAPAGGGCGRRWTA